MVNPPFKFLYQKKNQMVELQGERYQNMTEEECAVCLQETRNTVQPCGHFVCPACIDTWVEKHHYTCPMCRGILVRLRSDDADSDLKIVLRGDHAGITLVNAEGGVRVRRLIPCDRAYRAGLRPGDVITHLNSIPVCTHADAVAIVDRATQSRVDLAVTVKRRKRTWWRQCC